VALDAFSRMLSLPMHPGLTDQDVDDVCQAVEDCVRLNQA
jgi:dTDP-4-amino-4,6-dideoxygalactose transaminase